MNLIHYDAMRLVIIASLLACVPAFSHDNRKNDMEIDKTILFSSLDGSSHDLDGLVDGVLTLSSLEIKGGELTIDTTEARIVVEEELKIKDDGAVRGVAADVGPTLIIRVGKNLSMEDQAVIDAGGSRRGGIVFIDVAKDIILKKEAMILADGAIIGSEGGSVELRALHKIELDEDALVRAEGEVQGGSVLLSSLKETKIQKNATLSVRGTGAGSEGGFLSLQSTHKVELEEDAVLNANGGGMGGEIDICSNDALYVKKNSLITAGGRDASGEGGFITVQAVKEIHLYDNAELNADGYTGGEITLTSCEDSADAITIDKGRISAVGQSGNGYDINLIARQGGVMFKDSGNVAGSGEVRIQTALVVQPQDPPTTPPAIIFTDSPSSDSCDCPLLEGQLGITITSPEDGINFLQTTVLVTGRVSGAVAVTVNDIPAEMIGGLFSVTIPLTTGLNSIVATAINDDGETVTDSIALLRSVPVPRLDSFADLVNTPSVNLTGEAPGVALVEVSGYQGIFTVPVANDLFSADVPMGLNRINRIFLTSITDTGERSAPASIAITHDGLAPNLFIDFPRDGVELTNEQADVGGRVGDSLSGFMGLAVEVNGIQAIVDVGIGPNGTFFAEAVPLNLGENTITATAVDSLGNSVTRTSTVTRVEIAPDAPRMGIVSGNAQTGSVLEFLTEPIVVQVTHPDGTPFANKIVTFDVTRSNGALSGDPLEEGGLMLQARTDANGLAQAWWRMGTDAGCGNNRVEVLSRDIAGTTMFCASAMPGSATQINIGTGTNQKAEVGAPTPEPLRVWVHDTFNGVIDVPVTFTVRRGGGKVNGQDSVTVLTGRTGHVAVDMTLGPEEGVNEVIADFPGNTGKPAVFGLRGIARNEGQPTTFHGLVLDNAGRPIGGAYCSLSIGGAPAVHATTDETGHFLFENLANDGAGHLHVDGLPATTVGGNPIPTGSFPALEYEVVVIPNTQNSLPTSIPLPELDPDNAVLYDNSTDLELTVKGMAGLKMVIKAGSMTRADGSVPSPANPAIVSLNQVHFDDVPMPMPDGAAPPFAWTLQPAGAHFDPPIEVTYPNMSGLPPGSIAFFLSFDHDLGRFNIVATGQVSADGSAIVSDPGAGISVAGWGCNCPPYSVTGECLDCGPCETEVNGECVETEPCCDGVPYDPATEGCCDDVVYNLATEGCCEIGAGPFSNDTVYNLDTECCEDPNIGRNQVVNKNPITAGVILLGMCDGRVQNPNWNFQFDGCSLPISPGFDKDNPAGGADTHFGGIGNGPCDNHDICYQTCDPSDNARLNCDQGMLNDMRAVCNASAEPTDVVESCLNWANVYYSGLRAGGWTAFDGRQREVCNCCP